MTKEEKQTLLIALCGYLPYKLLCQVAYTINNETTLYEDVPGKVNDKLIGIKGEEAYFDWLIESVDIENVKPYLRPMSSMTFDEEQEASRLVGDGKCINEYGDIHCYNNGESVVDIDNIAKYINYLNTHYFDYRGLIKRGLAIEAPEGMY